MQRETRSELLARALLTIGALLPYWPLVKLNTLYVTDDIFSSDIFQGELPFRVLVAEAIKRGEFPLWSDKLCSGVPLGPGEPIGLLSFATMPTAAALDVFVITMLLVAAHGTYAFTRRLGASRIGSFLAGIAFAGSGVLACQLKHLGVLSTVVWLPVGLTLLDGALSQRRAPMLDFDGPGDVPDEPPSDASRALRLSLFGLVFAEQLLAGFPQSAYICALVYGAFAVFRAWTLRERHLGLPLGAWWLAATGLVVAIAMIAGAMVLIPLSDYASATQRASLGYEWAVKVPYWPRNVLTFLVPYVNGDVSDDTYRGESLFWEDYGYVGAATFLLALYVVVRERRRPYVIFLGLMTAIAYLLVLGPNTPFFKVAWTVVPGLKMFRLPTRFLFVVDFGLSVLGGLGLTRLSEDLIPLLRQSAPRAPRWIVVGLCAGTALDLFIHQPRQNPMVEATEWLAPPPMVSLLQNELRVRTLTIQHRDLHTRVFHAAHGWSDLGPHYLFRDSLQPNTGAYWGIASADCYNGAPAPWVSNTWGDHNGPGLLLAAMMKERPKGAPPPPVAKVLGTLGVTHAISPLDLALKGLTRVSPEGLMNLYRVQDSRLLRIVPAARQVQSDKEAVDLMLAQTFSPVREVLIHDPPNGFDVSTGSPSLAPVAEPLVLLRSQAALELEATAPETGGYLFLAETYDAGWTAEVDGQPTPVARANMLGRAIRLPPGIHRVRFEYQPAKYFRGLRMTVAGVAALLLATAVSAYFVIRRTRPVRIVSPA